MNSFGSKYKILGSGPIRVATLHPQDTASKFSLYRDRVEEIWQQELKQQPRLFNGNIASLDRVEPRQSEMIVFIHFVEYKYALAQRREPSLKLGIKPLGVSGMTFLKSGELVWGKRSQWVSTHAGFWELAPSGSLDSENVLDQLRTEFTEELGIDKKFICKASTFTLLSDSDDLVHDIGCKIELELSSQDLRFKAKSASNEYDEFMFIQTSDIKEFINQNSEEILPTSIGLLEASGII